MEKLKEAPKNLEPVTKLPAEGLEKPSTTLKPKVETQDEYELEIVRDYYGKVDVT